MVWSIIDEKHRQIIEELESQTDRGTAIIGAALLDKRLEEAIRSHLLENEITEKLLDRSQALSSFSAKIDLAHSLGLLGEKTHRDLNLIRKIRNDFAHFDTPLNFNSQSVANRCAELWFPKNVEINKQPLAPKEVRVQYVRAINILSSLLWEAIHKSYTRVSEPPDSLP